MTLDKKTNYVHDDAERQAVQGADGVCVCVNGEEAGEGGGLSRHGVLKGATAMTKLTQKGNATLPCQHIHENKR